MNHTGQQPIPRNRLLNEGLVWACNATRNGQSVQMPFVNDSLLRTVFERRGLPQHLDSFENLKKYLKEAFVGDQACRPFFQALSLGLERGRPVINQPVQLSQQNPDKMSLLHWVCQYGSLNPIFGCRLSDDMIGLLLQAGSDPNAIFSGSQTTPLFFAVKYASLKAVNMLLEAGANVHQRDIYGQTCLKNALEYPRTKVIFRLLRHLRATEMFASSDRQGGKFQISAADAMLDFATGDPPMSWKNLGMPSTDDFLEAFMIMRDLGARLTERGSSGPIKMICFSVNHPTQVIYPRLLRKLAQLLVGTYIPAICIPKHSLSETSNTSLKQKGESPKCRICFENAMEAVALYCDHVFCRECIFEYGKNGADCPICQAPLGRDLSPNNSDLSPDKTVGIDSKVVRRCGPKFFTIEQVEAEAKAQGICTNFSSCKRLRKNLVKAIENGKRSSEQKKTIGPEYLRNVQREDPSRNPSCTGKHLLELASNFPQVSGTPPSTLSLCPNAGMVSIEISINGVPLLARISNHSPYTVLSRSMVDQLGLKRIDKLTSRQFADLQGRITGDDSTFTCLEPMKVCFQGIEVTLRNAIEVSPDPGEFNLTVQLGQDFLNSGLLSVIDVQVGDSEENDRNFYRVVSDCSWPIPNATKESFRYYSNDGKMADLPLMHFDPFKATEQVVLTVTLIGDVEVSQCHWCSRGFPDGMSTCEGCKEAFYCDRRCQIAAWKVHRLTCGRESEDE